MNAVAPCFERLLGAICPPAAPLLIAPEIVVEQSPAAIATVLSPSQVRAFMDCQARWMFHYLWELPEPRNGNLALGIAVHAAVAWAFDTKLRENAYPEVGVNLPLPDERGIQWQENLDPGREWPELMGPELRIVNRSSNPTAFGSRVADLVSKVSAGDAYTRERAVWRLSCLCWAGVLTSDEEGAFGRALWSQQEADGGFPASTGLSPYVFLTLPGREQEYVKRLFRSRIVESSWTLDPNLLNTVLGATQIRLTGPRSFGFTTDEALRLFDALVGWQPRDTPIQLDAYDRRMKRMIGVALADAVLPFVDLNSLSGERVARLFSMAKAGIVSSAVVALPRIVQLDQTSENRAIELIQRSALGLDEETAINGLLAIQRWRVLWRAGELESLPQQLRQVVMTTVVARAPGLHTALAIASEIVGDGDACDDERRDLANALDRLRAETEYGSWDVKDPRTITLTLVRANCVRLADRLRRAGMVHDAIAHWVDAAKDDPVPEVRYALDAAEEQR